MLLMEMEHVRGGEHAILLGGEVDQEGRGRLLIRQSRPCTYPSWRWNESLRTSHFAVEYEIPMMLVDRY